MTEPTGPGRPIKVGVIVDQTCLLLVCGASRTPTSPRMVIGDINAKGGLLGRPLELHFEDGATDDAVAAGEVAAKLVEDDRRRRRLRRHSPARRGRPSRARPWSRAKRLYIYPEQYEGEESDPLIFCTGPVPAQQIDLFHPVADAGDRGRGRSTSRPPTTSGPTC